MIVLQQLFQIGMAGSLFLIFFLPNIAVTPQMNIDIQKGPLDPCT